MYRPLISTVCVRCALPALAATSSASDHTTRYEQIIADSVASNDFMGSVLVAQSDHVVLNKGYGFADLEWKVQNTPTTKFRLGSITKQFTAASILLQISAALLVSV